MTINKISIAWTDLTLEFHSIFNRKKTLVLNKVNGFAEFGTLNAVMGPSGVGLTSLLKCLNGMNNSKLSEDTKIRLNISERIRSAFIGHNEKEFLIMGLTAKQNMIYASKLKNSECDQNFDHQLNVQQIMTDLMIADTMNTKAKNCSGGEQKRLAIALELTAINKPNVIFCDEPTTGLDSNIAEVVIKCLKELSIKQNITIITTIHQPNSDVLQLFDTLYVLAKGGICVYWGTPQQLPQHMRDCGIICNENQIPIETLITIATKGSEDKRIVELRNKTTSEVKNSFQRRISETKLKSIKHKNKRFSTKDVLIVLKRRITELLVYKYQSTLIGMTAIIVSSFVASLAFSSDMSDSDDCFVVNQTSNLSCFEMIDVDNLVNKNLRYFVFLIWLLQFITPMICVTEKLQRIKIFNNEHQNNWYSSGVYYLTESIYDLIPTTINATLFAVITYFMTEQPNEAKRFWAYFYLIQISFHLIEGIGHLMAILLFRYTQLCYLIAIAFTVSSFQFQPFIVQLRHQSDVIRFFYDLSPPRYILEMVIITLYGFDRCPSGQISRTIQTYELEDDDEFFVKSSYLFINLITFRITSIIALLIMKNEMIFIYLNKYIQRKERMSDAIELQSMTEECYHNSNENMDGRDANVECLISEDNFETIVLEEGEEEVRDNRLSIAWIDMTLKIGKTFYSNEKFILRAIKGFVRFGTLTALMGPTGAGKTSLLKCLNGKYRNFMTKDSKIYLSNSTKIKTCFLAQDQREHITNGLTVKQTLIYASKLKNTGKDIDHEMNVNNLMNELAIKDIKDNNIEYCSSGQQKRVVMAMELTSEVKPNLICVDEPTSGVDSYSALLMIQYFKLMATKYKLSIITSIHQPNLEILMIFDLLYVLAKGGVSLYSGRPQHLRQHLNECDITCNESQIPIEVLLKIGANGYNDEIVIKLSEKTTQDLTSYEESMSQEMKLFPNGIPLRSKSFSLEELWHLSHRMITFTIRYKWIEVLIISMVIIVSNLYLIIHFDIELEGHNHCVPKVSNNCSQTQQSIDETLFTTYNIEFMTLSLTMVQYIPLILTCIKYASNLKIFHQEYRNQWYSTESYFMLKYIIELIPYLISVICSSAIVNTKYDVPDSYPTFLLVSAFIVFSVLSMGQIMGTIFESNPIIGILMIGPLLGLFDNSNIITRDLSTFFKKVASFNPVLLGQNHLRSFFYGQKPCPEGQLSWVMYRYELTDDDFDKSTLLLIYISIMYFIISYLCLKVKVNWDLIQIRIESIKAYFKNS